ncbi:pentatricopeptide repeat-containing protein At2g13600-like [Selaginella moellendorffii]|uniref:pentatricopeptide repeat-containing protein At2g13600-like n=1 Tax=Selaginella moellendorffii TaxID=88036 RepID=UPI000D1C5AFF|nr:pentatricopeptide repeat-containing protein At2g13600-like [Selaginella moellendorffii]|eukprot:XP_024522393.1 pentatricopeptide repeat-containing protein At2g13600-like [Selaginella moellendorffii]
MIHALRRERCRPGQAAALLSLSKDDKHVCLDDRQVSSAVDELDRSGRSCSYDTYASFLRQCGDNRALEQGKKVHALISRKTFRGDRFLGNLLVQMYGKCQSLDDAVAAFESIERKNLFTWTIMFAAFAHNGYVLQARELFDKMPQRDLVSWTTMVAAYASNGCNGEALDVFKAMDLEGVQVDGIAVLSTLDACTELAHGRVIHQAVSGTILEDDVKVGTALVTMYGRCHCLVSARIAFCEIFEKNLISWNAMVAAYAQNGSRKQALLVFRFMDLEGVGPGPVTFTSILEVCASSSALEDGRYIHSKAVASGCHNDVKVASALVNMYGKCGSVNDAKQIFDSIPHKNVVTWSAMVAAYAQNDCGKEALELGIYMDLEGLLPNEVTFVSMVDACACIPALRQGRLLHEGIRVNFKAPLVLELDNALIHMYGQCGALEDSRKVFDSMGLRDSITWNALITAYAQNGVPEEALVLFQDMKLDGTSPSELTFMSVLSACSHSGLLGYARQCFVSITGDFFMAPVAGHFRCLINLLGRAGRLTDAEELMSSMPFEASGLELASLLHGCKTQGSLRGGARIARKVMEGGDPVGPSSPYVLLSSIWRDSDQEEEELQQL